MIFYVTAGPSAARMAYNFVSCQSFSLLNTKVTVQPPNHPNKPVVDIPLHTVFLCFDSDVFLQILTCILLEERVVFMSTNYALINIVMEVNSYAHVQIYSIALFVGSSFPVDLHIDFMHTISVKLALWLLICLLNSICIITFATLQMLCLFLFCQKCLHPTF